MALEPAIGVVFGRPVEGKTTFSYICLPFHSPTQASQFTGTSSFYRSLWLHPLMTQISFHNTRLLVCLSGIQHCFSTLNLIAYLKEEDAAEPANGSYRSSSRKTTPDSTYGSVSSTSASGRTSPSNMSVISSTLSNFSLPFNSYSSTKSKKSTNNGSTVDETPPTIVRLNFSVEKRDQDKLFLRTNLTVIF